MTAQVLLYLQLQREKEKKNPSGKTHDKGGIKPDMC